MKPSPKFIHTSERLFTSRFRLGRKFHRRFCQIEDEPIFILGNHKSGTSAIAGLLGELVGQHTTIDFPSEMEMPTFHLVRQGLRPFQQFLMKNRLEFSRKIIKAPELTFLYPELKAFFPRAKFICIVRDPRANIRSILNRLKIPGRLSVLNQSDFSEITPTWALALDNSWLGLPQTHYIDAMATRWRYIMQLYLQQADDFWLIRYEDFCTDKVGQLKTLATLLNLKAKRDVSSLVNYQFQPKGNSPMSWEEFFGEYLDRIEHICHHEMEVLGYPQSLQSVISR